MKAAIVKVTGVMMMVGMVGTGCQRNTPNSSSAKNVNRTPAPAPRVNEPTPAPSPSETILSEANKLLQGVIQPSAPQLAPVAPQSGNGGAAVVSPAVPVQTYYAVPVQGYYQPAPVGRAPASRVPAPAAPLPRSSQPAPQSSAAERPPAYSADDVALHQKLDALLAAANARDSATFRLCSGDKLTEFANSKYGWAIVDTLINKKLDGKVIAVKNKRDKFGFFNRISINRARKEAVLLDQKIIQMECKEDNHKNDEDQCLAAAILETDTLYKKTIVGYCNVCSVNDRADLFPECPDYLKQFKGVKDGNAVRPPAATRVMPPAPPPAAETQPVVPPPAPPAAPPTPTAGSLAGSGSAPAESAAPAEVPVVVPDADGSDPDEVRSLSPDQF